MHLGDYTQIFWDFNGTLLDDVALGLRTVNILLKKRGLPTIDTVEAYHRLFRFPVQDYYEDIGLWKQGEDFSPVAHEWMAQYRSEEHTAPLREGAVELLSAICKSGVRQGVLSATENAMLREQLNALHLLSYFSLLLGRGDIYAGDKSSIARQYRAHNPHEKVLMIGDTSHDFLTATAGGFDCILVAGGHESRENLQKNGCPVLDNLYQVGEYLQIW